MTKFGAVALFSLVVGCGSDDAATRPTASRFPPPPSDWHYDPVATPHVECAPSSHIVAAARSTLSVEDAEAQARGSLAKQISSTIQVEVTNVAALVQSGENATMDRSVERSVNEQSSFTHNELIKAMPPHGYDPSTEEFFALVCLDRMTSKKVIENESQDHIARLDQSLTDGEDALAKGDTPTFIRAYRDAQLHVSPALSSLALIQAIRGASDPRTEHITARYAALTKEAARMRHAARLTVHVSGDGMSDSQTGTLVSSLRKSLESTGLPLAVDRKPCAATEKGRTHIAMTGQKNCKWGSLGHMCKPQFVVAATACGPTPRTLWEGSVDGAGGVHAKDESRALEKAVNDTKFDVVTTELQRVIEEEVPLEH